MALTPTQIQLIDVLADGQVHSGEVLGEMLGISRAAVWKALKKLSEYGLQVEQRAGSGYWLTQPLELLREDLISSALADHHGARCEVTVVASCSSTNTRLKQSAVPSAPAYCALFSEHQSAGRGRQGRTWRSTFGQGIYFSLAQEQGGGLERLAAMSLVIGVGVCQALEACGIEGVGLKWPNDLWFEDRKLGGILLEADGEFSGTCRWIAGVGVNWRLGGDVALDQAWVDVHELTAGKLPGRNEFCAQLLKHLIIVCDTFSEQGLAPFLESWTQRDVLRGRPVFVSSSNGVMSGVAEGLSAIGELQVRSGGRLQAVTSGEVSVRPQ